MNPIQETILKISFTKSLIITSISMVVFNVTALAIFMPYFIDDGIIAFEAMIVFMTLIFSTLLCYMLRCKIDHEGLCSASLFYMRRLRWDNVRAVNRMLYPPGFMISGGFAEFCIIPGRFLLKYPDQLDKAIDQHAPIDNMARQIMSSTKLTT